jgi:PPK2 family polyphosphate:nucleotide phosphotransferase
LKEIRQLLIHPSSGLKLSSFDADDTFGKNREDLDSELPELMTIMSDLQYKLYVENEKSLLIVLQGIDTSGKDGIIRHVISAFNPVSCRVESFKVPTSEELAHDFLWRVHKVVPRKGYVAVFNRSHYEDVVEARVQNFVSESICFQRLEQIKQFEKMLAENSVKILKFFLHISKQEQKKRLLDRLSDPKKRWKVNEEDYKKRKKWVQYMTAYTDAIINCSIKEAPWYVIPANNKWFRNWVVSKIITNALVEMKIKSPKSGLHYKKTKFKHKFLNIV